MLLVIFLIQQFSADAIDQLVRALASSHWVAGSATVAVLIALVQRRRGGGERDAGPEGS